MHFSGLNLNERILLEIYDVYITKVVYVYSLLSFYWKKHCFVSTTLFSECRK